MKKLLIFIALLFPLILVGCKSGSSNKFKTCWSSGDWRLCYSKNMKLENKDPPVFTMQGKAEPHYLVKSVTNFKNATKFIIRYKVEVVSGTPELIAKDCKTVKPGTIAAFFQRAGDDMYAKGSKQYYRWWSKIRPELEPGLHEYEFSLDPKDDQWISVWGKSSATAIDQFNAAKTNVRQFGVTFGGCGGAGHGILVKTGIAKITVESVRVE